MISQFEPETIQEWIDPFDSITLKIITVIAYIIEIFASIIMLFFVAYETQGYAGHYRTVINQLLSQFYGTVRSYSTLNPYSFLLPCRWWWVFYHMHSTHSCLNPNDLCFSKIFRIT